MYRNYNPEEEKNNNYSRKLISGKVTATEGVRSFDNLHLSYGSPEANRYDILRALQKETRFKIAWYIIFLAAMVVCLILEPKSWFMVLETVIVMINMDLVSRGKLIGIYIGIIDCLLYLYIAYTSGLYGEMIKMCAINIPLNIFAIVSWTKNLRAQKKAKYGEQKENTVVIRKLKKKSYIWIPFVIAALYVASFFGLQALGTNALFLSAAVLVFTIFSKVLSGFRYKENYLFSLFAGILSTFMWLQVIILSSKSGEGVNLVELPMLFNTLAMVTNDIQGYIMWKGMYRKIAVNGGEIFAMRKLNVKKIIKLRHTYQKLYWNKKVDMEKNS